MALHFHPEPGLVLLCDYSEFRVPEMVKERLVVIISPRLRRREGLCTVVPLSQTAPEPPQDYHCQLRLERPLPGRWAAESYWVKADMLATVGFHRLTLLGIGRDHEGKRRYITPKIPPAELRVIRQRVLCALDLESLTKHLD